MVLIAGTAQKLPMQFRLANLSPHVLASELVDVPNRTSSRKKSVGNVKIKDVALAAVTVNKGELLKVCR